MIGPRQVAAFGSGGLAILSSGGAGEGLRRLLTGPELGGVAIELGIEANWVTAEPAGTGPRWHRAGGSDWVRRWVRTRFGGGFGRRVRPRVRTGSGWVELTWGHGSVWLGVVLGVGTRGLAGPGAIGLGWLGGSARLAGSTRLLDSAALLDSAGSAARLDRAARLGCSTRLRGSTRLLGSAGSAGRLGRGLGHQRARAFSGEWRGIGIGRSRPGKAAVGWSWAWRRWE
jgi:hypothetical protein